MNNKKIRDIRYAEFVNAALLATQSKGYHAVTMAEIAATTGATAASISYYFGSKERLMFETMRHLLTILHASHLTYLNGANTPKERLFAIINANFDERFFTPVNCSFWVQFWSSAPYNKELARLQFINQHRVRSHFKRELKEIVPKPYQETIRRLLQSYMDGVWLGAAQGTHTFDAKHTKKEACAMLELTLNQF